MSLTENITDRKEAEEFIAFIGDKPLRFWEIIAAHAASQMPQRPVDSSIEPMGEAEAARFEKQALQWGKHQGEEVGSVPVGYLLFLAEGDEFTRKLRRYTASKVFALRQDQEGDE